MTSRGWKEEEFVKVAGFLMRCAEIAKAIQKEFGTKMVDFRKGEDFFFWLVLPFFVLTCFPPKGIPDNKEIESLRNEVREFSKQFPIPGNYFPKA